MNKLIFLFSASLLLMLASCRTNNTSNPDNPQTDDHAEIALAYGCAYGDAHEEQVGEQLFAFAIGNVQVDDKGEVTDNSNGYYLQLVMYADELSNGQLFKPGSFPVSAKAKAWSTSRGYDVDPEHPGYAYGGSVLYKVEDGFLTIRNMLFRSDSRDVVGIRVPLSALPEYENLPEEYTYPQRLDGLGMIHARMPMMNCVDGSTDGVSVYAPAVAAIHNINQNEAQLSGEFQRGESRVFASSDLFRKEKGTDGRMRPVLTDTIFSAVDTGPEDVPITIFSPELRDESFKRRREGYLRSIESIIGLQRGLLSDVQEQERTATEITSSKGDYALTVEDLQGVWRDAVKEAMRVCGILGPLYGVPDAHEIPADGWSIDYGDGILGDDEHIAVENVVYVDSEWRSSNDASLKGVIA